MSTILSQRNKTIQENIERTENIEDMRTFLKCLYNVQKEQVGKVLGPMSPTGPMGSIESSDVFNHLWNQISSQVNLDRFIYTYSLPELSEWSCRVYSGGNSSRPSIYIRKNRSTYSFLTAVMISDSEYVLNISEIGNETTKFDNLYSILRQIDGIVEKRTYKYENSFKVDFNRL